MRGGECGLAGGGATAQEARRALQAEVLQEEWEKPVEVALLAQRVEPGDAGASSYAVYVPAARVMELLAPARVAAAAASSDYSERKVHLLHSFGIPVLCCFSCCDVVCALVGSGYEGAARCCAGGCAAVSIGDSKLQVVLELQHALRLVSLPLGMPKGSRCWSCRE